MPLICPTVLAASAHDYREQMDRVAKFAERIQIDLTDGDFAPAKTIKPDEAWWPVGIKADFHLMYKHPMSAVEKILGHKPNMIIIQAEAEGDFNSFVALCRRAQVKVGVCLLQKTPPETIAPALEHIDHVLIFSGDLGHFGGQADLALLEKATWLKHHKPNLEIGWDGGINTQNISQLVFGGVDVLNVGGFIQKADNPHQAYDSLKRIADETGTT